MTVNERLSFLAERQRSTMLSYILGCTIETLEIHLNNVGHDPLILLLAGLKAELKSIDAAHAKARKGLQRA